MHTYCILLYNTDLRGQALHNDTECMEYQYFTANYLFVIQDGLNGFGDEQDLASITAYSKSETF